MTIGDYIPKTVDMSLSNVTLTFDLSECGIDETELTQFLTISQIKYPGLRRYDVVFTDTYVTITLWR